MTGGRPPRRHLAVQSLLESPAGRAALLDSAPELPVQAGRWLAKLCLLHNVPFAALVPDERMLPAESVRFFAIDQNWVDSLVDGALSVAAAAAPEAALVALHRPALHAQARALAGPASDAAEPAWSGLLLRSALVAGWPGLSVTGYDQVGPAEPLGVLRVARLAPSVLMVIFDGFLRRAEIGVPSQGIHFGVISTDEEPAAVAVRFIGGGPEFPPGTQPPRSPKVPVRFRDARRGVLDIDGLLTSLRGALEHAYLPVPPPDLGQGAFGIQLVSTPQRRSFVADQSD